MRVLIEKLCLQAKQLPIKISPKLHYEFKCSTIYKGNPAAENNQLQLGKISDASFNISESLILTLYVWFIAKAVCSSLTV